MTGPEAVFDIQHVPWWLLLRCGESLPSILLPTKTLCLANHGFHSMFKDTLFTWACGAHDELSPERCRQVKYSSRHWSQCPSTTLHRLRDLGRIILPYKPRFPDLGNGHGRITFLMLGLC